MKSFVVCSSSFSKNTNYKVFSATVLDRELQYAIIETSEPEFNPETMTNQVLVQKKAFSCNYREIALMLSAVDKMNSINDNVDRYFTLGSEFSGIVVQVGKNVESLKIGDRVIPNGEYPSSKENVPSGLPTNHGSAELEIFNEAKLLKIPDEMPFNVAAGFTIGGQTTYSMIEKLKIKPNSNILITAPNSNTSLFAINVLNQRKDLAIYALSSAPGKNEDALKKLGVREICYASNNYETLNNLTTTIGGGFDAIIDPFANIYLPVIINYLTMNGAYTSCGIANPFDLDSSLIISNHSLFNILVKNNSIIGNCLGKTAHLQNAIDDYCSGNLKVIIDSTIQNEPEMFFKRTFIGREKFGKVIYEY